MAAFMEQPPARITGKIVSSRSDEDQQQITLYAREYFKPADRKRLEEMLGKQQLTFDQDEVQALKSRIGQGLGQADASLIQGTNVDPGRDRMPGILQFYDSCYTIDRLKNEMRAANNLLTRSLDLDSNVWEAYERDIMYPDFVPLHIRNDPAIPKDHRHIYSITGKMQKVYQSPQELPDDKIVPKSTYDKCCDEALFLHSPLINTLQALAQGMFIVNDCQDFKLKAATVLEQGSAALPITVITQQDVCRSKEALKPGEWVNAMDWTDAKEHYLDAWYTPIVPNGRNWTCRWRNHNTTAILYPKHYVVDDYYGVYFNGGAKVRNAGEIGNFKPFALSPNRVPLGGAIGLHTHFENGVIYPHGDRTNEGVILTMSEDINAAMSVFGWHIISSCPALARAYNASGMSNNVFSMYSSLQRALEGADAKRKSSQVSSNFNVTNMPSSGAQSGSIPQCAVGFTPQFFTQTRPGMYAVVPESEALVSRDGRVELASHVDRDKIECVPRVTVAQMTQRGGLNNLQFNPVLVRHVDSGIPQTSDAVFKQVPGIMDPPNNAHSGAFRYETTDVDIYGPAMQQFL